MNSFEVEIEVDEDNADALAGELFALGAEAIEVRDREGLKLPGVVLPPDGKTWLICGFSASGDGFSASGDGFSASGDGVSTSGDGFTAENEAALTGALAAALGALPYPAAITSIKQRDDTDWAHKWKEFYKPLQVGRRLWVSPSWEAAPQAEDAIVVRLDPEMAFGTGQHQTTRLCLALLEALCDQRDPSELRVLDVGTGSGILAIAAALLGVREIIGIDNDEVSVATAAQNAARNGVAPAISARLGAMPDAAKSLSGRFDLILANVLADPLIEMAPALTGLLAPGGRLVLSGLLVTQIEGVSAAYRACGLALEERRVEDEWAALVMA